MLNLAQSYWNWKESFLVKQELRKAEREKMTKFRRLYGKYLDQASKSTQSSQLYETSERCTQLFIDCIEAGVMSVQNGRYETSATFGNGYKVTYWNGNKMVAYAHRSVFTDSEGNKISFNKEMPRLWCCYMILDKIEEAII